MDRRQFLTGALAGFILPAAAHALTPFGHLPSRAKPVESEQLYRPDDQLTVANFWQAPRRLSLHHYETGERLNAVYWANGALDRKGYLALCQFLRDFHEDEACLMDLTVLNIVRGIQGFYELNNQTPDLYVTSAFRTRKTQMRLRERGLPAANFSRHEKGGAIDLFSKSVPASRLSQMGVHLNKGGVGYYPNRNFIHVDNGGTRHWKDYR